MLSSFASVYVLLYLLSFIASNNLDCYRHCGCPACVCVCVSVRSFLPLRASISRNIVTYVFTATRKTLYIGIIIVIFAEMLRSEATAGVICLPRMPLTAPELYTKYGYQRNPRRQRLLRAHILNINMFTYITSAHGHEKDA